MTTAETEHDIIMTVPLADATEPQGFREVIPEGVESSEGLPEIEKKIATNGDPRSAVAEWKGSPGQIEVYSPWAERTERWVLFVPRPGSDGKYNKIAFIRDLTQPDAPVLIRRKLALSGEAEDSAPLTRREIYNQAHELPQVIEASGGDPSKQYPESPHAIRDRVERLVLDAATGNVMSVTGDYCYPADGTDQSTRPLFQCEVEFKGVTGESSPTLDGVMDSITRVSTELSNHLAARGLDPEHTDVSKSKWLEDMTRAQGHLA